VSARRLAPLAALGLSLTLAAPPLAFGADATVAAVGTATVLGAPSGINRPVVSMAAAPGGGGYWLVGSDGGVYNYGSAGHFGTTAGLTLRSPVIDMAPTPSGNGYWLVASDGGVFNYGDAVFAGSLAGKPLNRPAVAVASTPSGRGYYVATADGGVATFGDAIYKGSLPELKIPGDIVDIVVRPQGDGYWLIGADGSAFAFGAAPNIGGLPDRKIKLNARIVGAVLTPSGQGLWMAAADGGVFTAGDAPFIGATSVPSGQRLAAVAATADGTGLWLSATTGLLPARSGQRGAHVQALQQRLLDLGYWLSSADGSYGHTTSQAVMAFQKVNHLERTGNADAVTVDLLSRAAKPSGLSTTGDVIEIDKARQVMFSVIGGQTRHVLNVSSGSDIPYVEKSGKSGKEVRGDAHTPVGRYRFYFERPTGWWESDLGQLYRPKYFIGGIAVHGSNSIPGHPASHGCIRVSTAAMDWIWATDLMPRNRAVWVY
jgi:peptidoglycan hydrolase-like protein with peptidoglycan-binding domain